MQPEGEEWTKIDAGVAAPPPQRHLANATLFMLARNSDVDSAVHSVREMEDRFNHNYGYPWVFLNEEPFSEDFIRCAPKPPSFLSKARRAAPVPADLTVFSLGVPTVACQISSLGPCNLGRSHMSIGISQTGSTRP